MENHNYNKIQQEKLERKHLINFFRQLTLRDRVKFLAVRYQQILHILKREREEKCCCSDKFLVVLFKLPV